MRIEDVNIQFEKALNAPYDWSMGGFTITCLAFGIILFIIGIVYFWVQEHKSFEDLSATLPGFFIIAITLFVYLMAGKSQQQEQVEKNIAKWKQDYAIPYINALPPVRREIVFIKIEATSTQELKDHGPFLRTQEVNRTPLTVSYKDNGEVVTKTDWYNANMGLIADNKPFFEYVSLPEPLGVRDDGKRAEFWAGPYNQMVYLPMNYEFKEIK